MKQYLSYLLVALFLFPIQDVSTQTPKKWTSASLHDGMKKLNFLGSVLYFAAHPDDENTRLISYLSNVRHAETAYLSLTRGDGGQNLIGSEIREQLGIIRTQELLAARYIDDGQQFFSRANDFGFSKHPDETFNMWDREKVLEDAVWVIRNFQPDVIINRFNHRTPGVTHGHHTASAVISVATFNKSGRKDVYPEQLEHVAPWKPERIFFNTYSRAYANQEDFDHAIKNDLLGIDVGVYLPKRGESITEIAARSRGEHKSQGMGRKGTRGSKMEYLELVAGDLTKDADDLFDGINTSWTRVKDGAKVGEVVGQLLADFDFDEPEKSIDLLLQIHDLISVLEDGYWKTVKLKETENLIEGCLGLFLEAVTTEPNATAGETVRLKIEAVNRSKVDVKLESLSIGLAAVSENIINKSLNPNQAFVKDLDVVLSKKAPLTNAYWLNEQSSIGMYTVEEQTLRGKPQSPPAMKAYFDLLISLEGAKTRSISIIKDVRYKSIDPVKGERYSPFEITPPVLVGLEEQAYVFADNRPQEIMVKVGSAKDSLAGKVELCHPQNWRVEPAFYEFLLERKGQENTYKFTLFPPEGQEEAEIVPLVTAGEEAYTKRLVKIAYDHIPTQTVLLDASAKVLKLEIKKEGQYIGYLMGAGDDIPQALEQIGYQVTLLEDRDMNIGRLKDFDAIILGVRAYNTLDRIAVYQPHLMQYVKEGGTLIVQYNTGHRLKIPMEEVAPFPLTISRDRITVEEAAITILAPEHPVMNEPNKITTADFDNWVQERGLYFPNEWSEEYTAILSGHDPGEPARNGGLLIAPYGKGYYIYTAYSWFRELPAGVAGAYRIFTNMISLGNKAKP